MSDSSRYATATRRQQRFPIASGPVEVVDVRRVARRLTRIVVAGDVLATMPDDEPGEYVTLIWPRDGQELLVPEVGRWRFPPGGEAQHTRNYTVRRFDRDAGRMTIDLVIHDHEPDPEDPDGGFGGRWAARAQVGERLGICGPRIHWVTDPDAAWTLMAGDETAIPAIAAAVERRPAGHPFRVVLDVHDADDEAMLDVACPDLEVTWLHRGDAPCATPERLVDALRQLELPDGPPQLWAAGESWAVRGVREHLRDERGFPRGAIQALGYWKHRATPEDDEA